MEMKAFVGVILNMSIIQLPVIKDYWSTCSTTNFSFFGYIQDIFIHQHELMHVYPLQICVCEGPFLADISTAACL